MTPAQGIVRKALREASRRHGQVPLYNEAIGYVESRWTCSATNKAAADGARGGAWGPTQITEMTARQCGYTGEMAALLTDPELAAEWTCIIMSKRPGGAPTTLEDAGAWWNAGRSSVTKLGPDHLTRKDYIPKLQAALAVIAASPLA